MEAPLQLRSFAHKLRNNFKRSGVNKFASQRIENKRGFSSAHALIAYYFITAISLKYVLFIGYQ